MRASVACIILFLLAVIAAPCGCRRRSADRDWTRALCVWLSEDESLEYGWETEWHEDVFRRLATRYNGLVWRRKGNVRRFLVNRTEFRHDVELRGTVDPNGGLWVATSSGRQVEGALDRKTGIYFNFRGMKLDGSLSLKEQSDLVYGATEDAGSLPNWAKPRSGILLARMAYGK